jgi:hypothetical protein
LKAKNWVGGVESKIELIDAGFQEKFLQKEKNN